MRWSPNWALVKSESFVVIGPNRTKPNRTNETDTHWTMFIRRPTSTEWSKKQMLEEDVRDGSEVVYDFTFVACHVVCM